MTEIRQFEASVEQQGLSLVQKEAAWKDFLRKVVRRLTPDAMHEKMARVASKFEEYGRPMGAAKDD